MGFVKKVLGAVFTALLTGGAAVVGQRIAQEALDKVDERKNQNPTPDSETVEEA